MNKRIIKVLLPFAAAFAFVLPAKAGERLTLEQTPEQVQQTIREHVQNGKLGKITRDDDNGKLTVYEVEYTTVDGDEYELKIAEDGRLLSKEED